MIERVRPVLKYANRYVEVFDDEVRFPDGSEGTYLRITHPAPDGQAVVVLPIREGHVALVRTYRYPIGEWQWGLPRGFGQGGDVLKTAEIELRQELGVSARDWRRLGNVTPDSGMLAINVAFFLAIVEDGELNPEDLAEVQEATWLSTHTLLQKIATGDITDGFTLSAVALALTQGHLSLE